MILGVAPCRDRAIRGVRLGIRAVQRDRRGVGVDAVVGRAFLVIEVGADDRGQDLLGATLGDVVERRGADFGAS
jgi:hypothetical protein